MHASVQDNTESTVAFTDGIIVKQGYVLDPILFDIMFSAIQFDASSSSDIGINVRYCINGSVFNFRRFQGIIKAKIDIINKFLFADDWVLNATTKANK